MANDRPIPGVQYSLTGGPGEPCIANGNSWAESRVVRSDKEEWNDARRNHWESAVGIRIRERSLVKFYEGLRFNPAGRRNYSEICTVFMARGIALNENDFESCMSHLDNLPGDHSALGGKPYGS